MARLQSISYSVSSNCRGGGMADAADLKSASRKGSVGSNPTLGTSIIPVQLDGLDGRYSCRFERPNWRFDYDSDYNQL